MPTEKKHGDYEVRMDSESNFRVGRVLNDGLVEIREAKFKHEDSAKRLADMLNGRERKQAS